MGDSTPKVRFFSNANGENVAYAVSGQGPALVVPAWWVSHLQLDWEQADFQRFFLALGEHHTVVRYDRPGVGLSDRQRSRFTLQDELVTLSGLIDHLALDRCALLGISCGGPTAILYARANPQRVSKLVFAGSFIDGSHLADEKIQTALRALVSAYWGLGAKAIIDLFDPGVSSEERKRLGRLQRESAEPAMAEALLKLTFSMDAREAASLVDTPALVLHRHRDRTVNFDAGRQLASTLRNAELVGIEGDAHPPWMGTESGELVAEILRFTEVAGSTPNQPKTGFTGNQFKQTGDVWTLCFAGKTVHLKQSRGLSDLAVLMANRNREIHVRELTGGGGESVIEAESPVLDKVAIAEYRQRLVDIEEEKQQAAATGDDVLYERLEQEEDAITDALKQGVGLAGRQRSFQSDTEKARKAVSARIRDALKRIAKVHPALADHLTASVQTGNYCRYNSDEDFNWLV